MPGHVQDLDPEAEILMVSQRLVAPATIDVESYASLIRGKKGLMPAYVITLCVTSIHKATIAYPMARNV